MSDDLEIVLTYLERQWLPVAVGEAYDRLRQPPAIATVVVAAHCPLCGQLKDTMAFPTCHRPACVERYAQG
jgi:hypothetical protein